MTTTNDTSAPVRRGRPNPHDPQHVMMFVLQRLGSDLIQADDQIQRERESARSKVVELMQAIEDRNELLLRVNTCLDFIHKVGKSRSSFAEEAKKISSEIPYRITE